MISVRSNETRTMIAASGNLSILDVKKRGMIEPPWIGTVSLFRYRKVR